MANINEYEKNHNNDISFYKDTEYERIWYDNNGKIINRTLKPEAIRLSEELKDRLKHDYLDICFSNDMDDGDKLLNLLRYMVNKFETENVK